MVRSALTPKDCTDVRDLAALGVDAFALSFVQNAQDLLVRMTAVLCAVVMPRFSLQQVGSRA